MNQKEVKIKATEEIAVAQQGIETDPTLRSNYWHLCLGLLLQGKESEAKAIWLSIIEKANVDQVKAWTSEIVALIKAEAMKFEAVSDFDSANQMHISAAIAQSEAWKKIKGYKFTTDWFSRHIPIWEKYLKPLANKSEINILEIGSWEGLSACWLLDFILTHESSRISCIDLFEPSIEYAPLDNQQYEKSQGERFDFNISQTGVSKKVTKIIGDSKNVMRSLSLNNYDMLYIDGSHLACNILTDAVLGWGLVKVGGLVIFDDYGFMVFDNLDEIDFKVPDDFYLEQQPKTGIDAFLKVFSKQLKIIHQGDQVIVQKTS